MIIRADLNLGRQGMKGLTLGRRFSLSTFFPLRKVSLEKSFPFEVKVYARRISIASSEDDNIFFITVYYRINCFIYRARNKSFFSQQY